MRDPKRIDLIIDEIREVWKQFPDQRLGQLISNFVERSIKFEEIRNIDDLSAIRHLRTYNIEDDELLTFIKQFRKEYSIE